MRAVVNIFGVPEDNQGTYHIRNWLRVPLFTCTLEIDEAAMLEPRLPITLVKNGELIAQSFYALTPDAQNMEYCTARDGINAGTTGVIPVGGSTKHFILTIEKGRLRALVGIAFIDRSDAIDFTYLLHEYARPRAELPKRERKTWSGVAESGDPASAGPANGDPAPTLGSHPAPTLVGPPESTDDDEFGDFQ